MDERQHRDRVERVAMDVTRAHEEAVGATVKLVHMPEQTRERAIRAGEESSGVGVSRAEVEGAGEV